MEGALIEIKLKLPSELDNVKLVLTGGSSRSWKFDVAKVPGPLTGGPNDGAPTGFFGGGPLADCQIDDTYTFTQANDITYNGGDGTFVAGQSCQAARNFTTTYTFTNVAGGAGIGQINLPVNNQFFIGVTDRPSENVYRIISIDDNRIVLRVGNGTSGVIFYFFFVRAN